MNRSRTMGGQGAAGPPTRRVGAFPLALIALCLAAGGVHAQSPAGAVPVRQVPPIEVWVAPPADAPAPGTTPFATTRPSPVAPPRYGWVGSVLFETQGPPAEVQGAEKKGSVVVAPAPPDKEHRRFPLEVSWDYGLRFESPDDRFSLHVGGVGQIDTVWLIGPQSVFAVAGGGMNGVGNAEATLIRRAILQADGHILGQFDYSVEFDFANASNDNSGLQPPSFGNLTSSPAPLNVWMQVRDVPYLGNVRIGNQVKPIGLTNNTPLTFLPFMERPDNQDAFYGPFDNGYALGISSRNWSESERLTWQYGIYQPATNVFGVALNKYSAGARVTGLPWYEDDGRRLIHLGLGYWGGEVVQDQLRVRARPLLRNAPGFAVPVLVDTGEVPGSRQYTIGPEFAMVLGPWTIQAEWAGQFLTDAIAPSGAPQGTVFYHGGYVEVLYFLTGEHQPYLKREGAFGRVIPNHDFHCSKDDGCSGCGAWQVGVRFSYLDLNSKAIQGGNLYDWTLGVNWFLNPNMKFQLNYVLEHRDVPQVAVGWINGFGVRAAYDF